MPSMGLSIRSATANDLPAIIHLLSQLGYELDQVAVKQRFASVIAAAGHAVLAGERNGKVAALLHLYERPALEKPPEVVVQALVVDVNARQGGIGKAMMARAEAWAADRGYRSVTLGSEVSRLGSHAFYQSLGYTAAATSRLFRKSL
jgi:N-acetylglutamate synthase-like GNAT family acetyltransferase